MKKIFSSIPNGIIYFFGWCWGSFFRLGLKLKIFYFPFVSEFISRVPFSFGCKFRRAVYDQLLSSIPADVLLNYGTKIEDRRTTFGKDVWVSSGCYIDYVLFGDYVLIGPNAVLLSGGQQHKTDRLDIPIKLQGNNPKEPVRIEKGAWIGAGCIIMADIGHDAIVGAGSVVINPVPPYAVVMGNPARVISVRKDKNAEML